MDRLQRLQLDELRAEQKALHTRLVNLDSKIERLIEQLNEPASQQPTTPTLPTLAPVEAEAAKPLPAKAAPQSSPASASRPVEPPPLPETLPGKTDATASSPPASASAEITPSPNEKASFEIQLGTVWLVRVGIVILLTGLVFLGNYAYQNFIGRFGPAGKLALLYFCGGALTAVGARLERKGDSLRNYARVLMAGGFATLYYATYAAHFVERLRIIHSPFIGGMLLLALAGGLVFIADRKRSQTLAIGAVLLSYYTAAINPLGNFTLFSNLLLTGAAVFFLVRNRWTTITFTSLLGTYLSYGYWRFFHENEWILRVPTKGEFWTGSIFLLGYWLLFTAGALLSREGFKRGSRAAFISFNNAAFFAFVSTALPSVYPHSFWTFSLGLGVALLALALISKRLLPDERLLDGSYLSQGLLLVTIGLAAKITGYQLALVLALESAALVTCASLGAKRNWHAWIFQIAAMLVAGWSCLLAVDKIENNPALALPLGGIVAVAFLYDARWLKHLAGAEQRFSKRCAFFSVLALAVGAVIIWHEVALNNRSPVFAAIAVAVTIATALHDLVELTSFGQIYAFTALWLWFFNENRSALPWWNPLIVLVAMLALNQWFQRQKLPLKSDDNATPLQVFYALGAAGLVLIWLEPKFSADQWLLMLGALSLIGLALGVAARAWSLALAAQLFTWVCIVRFVTQLGAHPHWPFSLAAVGAIALNGFLGALLVTRFSPAKNDGTAATASPHTPTSQLAFIYRIAALVMFIQWGFEYIPAARQFWFFVFSALALFALAMFRRLREPLVMCAVLAVVALVKFWVSPKIARPLLSLDTFALIAMLSAQRLGKKWLNENAANLFPREAQIAAVAVLLTTLWLHVSRWAATGERHFFITISWTLLAACIFAAGLALRERAYRLGGLIILAATVGRIFLVDVWQLETVYRILSFIVLGVVLLALGFVYNKFAEKFRDWI